MQQAGSVVCHMISRLKLDIPVLFVDTGVMFQETLDTRDRIAREYGLNVVTLQPELSMQEQTEKYGVLYLSVEGQKQCCHMRKVEPLTAIRGKYDALIGSLRRSDGGKRGECPILAVDPEMNALRINPLAMFEDEPMQKYIEENRVIVNPLHSQGFSTIGCNRCTTPVLPSEPKRAGRWRHWVPGRCTAASIRPIRMKPLPRRSTSPGPGGPDSRPEDRFHDLGLRNCPDFRLPLKETGAV